MTDYPIEPGSALDHALDLVVDVENGRSLNTVEERFLILIKSADDAHMRALGTRSLLRTQGLHRDDLDDAQRSLWYGQLPKDGERAGSSMEEPSP